MKPAIALGLLLMLATPARALPPVDEVPEEILRNEVITEARSPLDGKPMTAREYAEFQVELEQANQLKAVPNEKIRKLVGLLKLRKFIKTVLPFVPIK
jgi:hypothetical protein